MEVKDFNIEDYDKEDQARMIEFGKWKTCSKCGEDKPRSWTEFHRDKAKKDGIRGQCKTCKKDYHQNNKEAIAEYGLRYRKENREAIAEYKAEYYIENKEYYAEYRKENREAIAERMAEYYIENKEYYAEYRKENREAIAEYMAEYNRKNPEIMRRINQRRRSRLANLPHTLTIEEWEDSLSHFNDSCSYCGTSQEDLGHTLHQEHIIPVSKGGGYVVENIIPSCGTCNRSKNAWDMEEWYRDQPFFTEERLLMIKEWQLGLDLPPE